MSLRPSKLIRKQKRCRSLVAKDTNLFPSESPTRYVAICNAGLSTGIVEQALMEEVLKYGRAGEIVMIANKSYCFLKFADRTDAESVFEGMNGKSKLGQNGCVIYMSYFNSIPLVEDYNKNSLPPGAYILTDFVNVDEETLLIDVIGRSFTGSLKHRAVKHFGYEFLYNSNNVDLSKPLEESIPMKYDFLWMRLKDKGPALNWYKPDQLTVNQYMPGHGIPQHVDTHSAFDDPILSLSLESDIVMDFRKNEERLSVLLPRFSLLILSGESRYDWTHGISSRTMDIVQTSHNTLTTLQRSKRTSLTFRKTRKGECECLYPALCDRQKSVTERKEFENSVAQTLEENNVHHIYDNIADHFSGTRYSQWPRVSQFLKQFSNGSVILDVGCGNGKYLSVEKNRFNIGCDRSSGLLNVCRSKQLNVFRCDCRSVPIRSSSADGVISIAVIHHLANKSRRLEAIIEIARILRSGGLGLIYVWAKNQSSNSKKSNYLRQRPNVDNNVEMSRKTSIQIDGISSLENHLRLPIHVNRTEFLHKDILVPWKLKSKENSETSMTFLRFYHVFDEFELEGLCAEVSDIEIQESYYDEGNYCVIFKKN